MPDLLTHDERAWAWLASWNPSFEGIAVVNKDFTFRAVNQQFCKILGVTPAELINNTFQDVTPKKVRDLDTKNAKLVIEGTIRNYLLPKTYEFSSGKVVDVTLLVSGVYHPETDNFQFFVSKIMERKQVTLTAAQSQPPNGLLDIAGRRKIFWGFMTVLGAGLATAADDFVKIIKNLFE